MPTAIAADTFTNDAALQAVIDADGILEYTCSGNETIWFYPDNLNLIPSFVVDEAQGWENGLGKALNKADFLDFSPAGYKYRFTISKIDPGQDARLKIVAA